MNLQEFLLLCAEVFIATLRRSAKSNTLAIYTQDKGALIAVLSA